MYLCAALLAAMVAVCSIVGLRKFGGCVCAKLSPANLTVLLLAAAIATSEAQKRSGGWVSRRDAEAQRIEDGRMRSFGETVALSLPGAVTNRTWLARGAYEDWFHLSATNWWARTPGGGWSDNICVFSFGGLQVEDHDGVRFDYPPPFAQKLSLAPEANWGLLAGSQGTASLFWHVITPSNTVVLTWLDALYARSPTNLVGFQAELFNDGSFDYRYADHTDHYVAVLPFDLDGDGLENSVDPSPEIAGPDAHGTNAEWYNTVCSNVLRATVVQGRDPPVELTWRDGVNSNAYYFVDVVTERGPAPIWFTGDRESGLGDPVVVAMGGATNRVPLLMGVDYAVTSDTPFTVSFPVDYMYPEVQTNEPCAARIRWPLDFQFTEGFSGGDRVYTIDVVPYDPGGMFSWEMRGGTMPRSGGCSCVSYSGRTVVFGCSESCDCGGDCKASGSYNFEGASFSVTGGVCRCGFNDPEPYTPPTYDATNEPSVSVSFSKSAVIFEEEYEYAPGKWEARRSTRVRLNVSAYGGSNGGTLSLSADNLYKLAPIACGPLPLPSSVALESGESYSANFLCEGSEASMSEGDVEVSGTFTDASTGESITNSAALTVVRVELRPHVIAPDNNMVRRHTFGVCELVEHLQEPAVPIVVWNPVGGGSNVVYEGAIRYRCPLDGCVNPLMAEIRDVSYLPKVKVIEPQGMTSKVVGYVLSPDLVHKGEAGGIGMKLILYVTPLDVSFSQIAVEEVPCFTYEVNGYFENPYFNGAFAHTGGWWGAGAGRWRDVDLQNRMSGYDMAVYTNKIPWLTQDGAPTSNPEYTWTDGSVYIDNPFGWNVKGTIGMTPPYKTFGEDIRDTILLNSQGKVGVFKLDNWVYRTTNDIVHLYGPRGYD